MGGENFNFDCFECAIEHLAPKCETCGVKIIGHGSETLGGIYCSAHCARALGEIKLRDRSNEMSF